MVRIVHFLVELGLRLPLVGHGSEARSACPLNQYLLADAVGLSVIHVNRILRQLRERGLLTFRDGRVIFHDLPQLRSIAGYRCIAADEQNGPS